MYNFELKYLQLPLQGELSKETVLLRNSYLISYLLSFLIINFFL